MKKLLVVLLSLGLIVAFGATASAADVKFGGSYYLVGVYENNPLLTPDETAGYSHYSKAFFYQRFRLQPVLQIAEGLTFTFRLDALEKVWGSTNQVGNSVYAGQSTPDDLTASRKYNYQAATTSGGAPFNNATSNPKIQESLEFERAYVTFMTGIGQFDVGYQNVDDWGTDFGDYSNSRPKIGFMTKVGPMILGLAYEKVYENMGTTQILTSPVTVYPQENAVDADKDSYAVYGIYKDKGVEAGLLYKYYAFNSSRPSGIKSAYNLISPYVKATFGPVYVEGEATYWFGKFAGFEDPYVGFLAGTNDVDLQAYSAYLKGKINVGPAYFGALFSYASGDDLGDKTKAKTALSGGGPNFAPALILMNDGLNTQTGGCTGCNPGKLISTTGTLGRGGVDQNAVTSKKYNTVIYNAFAGFNPTPKLNVEAALTYATVDKKAMSRVFATGVVTEAVSDKLGTEFDVKATYKIYDNLTYMVGAGYLWTGDYFKGSNASNKIDNDYILLNQLTLSF